jgi:hypothetical protein
MKDLNLLKKVKVEELPNYYIDETGRLCYQNKDGKWMYCKKVDNKPGWVWAYSKGQSEEYNQTKLAIKYLPGYKQKYENKQIKKEVNFNQKRDGRYKVGVDTGIMSHLKIELPLKPYNEIEKPDLNKSCMGDKNREIGLQKLKKKNNEKIYSFTMKNTDAIIGILNKNGYNITKI